MDLSASAHVDTFARDNLPPSELWPTIEFTLPELQYPDRLNAATVLIDDAVATFGADRPCLLTPDGIRWTYGDLLTKANQVAQVLTEDFGVVPGNRVLLRGPNNPWLVACWLGVLKAGGVVVTTMQALRAQEIEALIALTGPVVGISDHRFADELHAAAGPKLALIAYGGAAADDLVARCATKSGAFVNVQTAADDVALLGPTSGTTGTPKITMHFHRDILANADTFARLILQPTVDDVFSGSPPLAFTFGLGGLVVFPLRFGASSLLIERATPVELAELTHAAGVTILSTAPTAYRAILRGGKADLLRGIRRAISAGEHLPGSVWAEVLEKTGLKLINGIGSTEMLHVFISAADDEIRPGATGKAVAGFRAMVMDEDGNEALVNQLGRLAVIGPTGCRYLNDDRQLNYVKNGWNVTGDTFRRDEDGYFWYEARSDSMIVSSGYNIGAPEVEAALGQHDDVVESAVIGRPDADRGSIVSAYVVLREGVPGDDAKRKELQDFVKQTIAPYKYPREVTFVTELPRNPSGKLQHFQLRDRLVANDA
ncbi:2-aminobenzoate-CoA ligase [Cryobacterium psychrotolerans]|uniref:2-aminobenzoate-CoA ligase n=1 Tax=Cryobacterium psychrotolerans TaxID=386301 RepID=A0A1G9B963_9MICO|nr:AMP-binding protein [Cryobacterium psychrotolerans]TFD84675.1 2-aminobenzoate-CoA ligase [Cryobacterium psychrotolerans]SDK36038.1 2-aminobenzoate-CoA ligase [Cryobacterium psychrotolerans]